MIMNGSTMRGGNDEIGTDVSAQARVTLEHLEELSRRLGIPVVFDEIGWLRDGIELHVERCPNGLKLIAVIISREATVKVLLAHDLSDLCERYDAMLRKLRALPARLQAIVTREQEPHKPGSMVWLSYETMLTVDTMIARRESACMGQGIATPSILAREIEHYEREWTHHSNVADAAEMLGVGTHVAPEHLKELSQHLGGHQELEVSIRRACMPNCRQRGGGR